MSAGPDRPLSGITIVDLTRVLAGPYATMILADHGARVIKIERPGSGDDARQYGPFIDGRSGYFASVNRGKESIALDLTVPADREVFEGLLDTADVLTENFRPGTMDRLGYDWPTLHTRYPRLIYGSVSGFGATAGPYRDRPAYDMIVQAMSGIMSVTGHPGGPPTRVGVSVGDLAAGLFLTIGVTMALLHRQRTGHGDLVDIAMLDCQLALLEYPITRHHATGETPGPVGTYRPAVAPPFGLFRAADGHLVVAAGNDRLFARLAAAVGAADLASDPRYLTGERRKDNETALQHRLEGYLARRTVAQWCDLLTAAGVPAGPINTVDMMLADSHVAARGMLVAAEAPGRTDQVVGTPIKFGSITDLDRVRAAPELDQDRSKLLLDLAERQLEPG